MNLWKYVRRTFKGLSFFAIAMITLAIFVLGIAWTIDVLIEPLLGNNTLQNGFIALIIIWTAGFLVFAAYDLGKEWENRR